MEGEVIETRPVEPITPERLEAVRAQFTGPIRQVPPMHSALKKDGKALYEYARAGEEVEREARDVTIHALTLEPSAPTADGHPKLKITARVSKGTYIRTLGEDIGQALGCGGHLTALRRIRTGPFDIRQCLSLDALEAMDEDERLHALAPIDVLLADAPAIELNAPDAARFLSGMRRRGTWPDAAQVRVYGPPTDTVARPQLLGSAHVRAGELIPTRLLSPIDIQQILQASPARVPA